MPVNGLCIQNSKSAVIAINSEITVAYEGTQRGVKGDPIEGPPTHSPVEQNVDNNYIFGVKTYFVYKLWKLFSFLIL